MRKLILNLHLYGGLLCSSYLIIFGISSLNFNHHFAKPGKQMVTWEQSVTIPPIKDQNAAAEAVRDALGLAGWTLPWATSIDADGNLRFRMSRPSKEYSIVALVKENRVKVEEERKGFWPAINALHALMQLPNAPFMTGWGWYTELCTWVVLFSGVSGVYLWANAKRERAIGLSVLVLALVVSVALMVYVRVIG